MTLVSLSCVLLISHSDSSLYHRFCVLFLLVCQDKQVVYNLKADLVETMKKKIKNFKKVLPLDHEKFNYTIKGSKFFKSLN